MKNSKPFEMQWDAKEPGALQSAELTLSLDAPARYQVRYAVASGPSAQLKPGSLPQEGTLKCYGKSLFKGSLHSVRSSGLNLWELEFRDPLDRITRVYESEFLKGQRLESFLSQIAQFAGLRPRFFGSFTQDLIGSDLAGKSYYDHLLQLSYEQGFSFTVQSATQEILFIRLGKFRESFNLSPQKVQSVAAGFHVGAAYGSAEVTAFDPSEGKGVKWELGNSEIHDSLGFLKEQGSFLQRSRWKLADGRMEAVAKMGDAPDDFRRSLALQIAKKSLGSESVTLKVLEPVAFPGDQLHLDWGVREGLGGKYLVQKVITRVQSSAPSHEITLVRA